MLYTVVFSPVYLYSLKSSAHDSATFSDRILAYTPVLVSLLMVILLLYLFVYLLVQCKDNSIAFNLQAF